MKKTRFVPVISDERKELAENQIFEQSKRIEFFITEFSIELLAQKMKDGDFDIPPYQREFTWEPERKSKFIESLLMGLPIPFFFFWERADGKLEIVDGSQRLRTIKEFIYDGFRLGELEKLNSLRDFSFADLLESRQRKFKNRSIRGVALNEHADEEARFDMFERINTSSKMANKAEVRRGALQGQFMDFVVELAKNTDFRLLAPLSKKLVQERGYEELISRFFAYGDGLGDYKDLPSEFIFNYIKKMNKCFSERADMEQQYQLRFEQTIRFVKRVFPLGFRRTASKNANATPRSRFEAIAIGSWMALQQRPELADAEVDVSSWHLSKEFADVVGADGANAKKRLTGRIDFVKNKLLDLQE